MTLLDYILPWRHIRRLERENRILYSALRARQATYRRLATEYDRGFTHGVLSGAGETLAALEEARQEVTPHGL